jgi:fluoroacetyl-CoA thioesterase
MLAARSWRNPKGQYDPQAAKFQPKRGRRPTDFQVRHGFDHGHQSQALLTPGRGLYDPVNTMRSSPRVGTVGEFQFVVEPQYVIDFATDGMPAVLSTPRLIGLIERTAREALLPFLESDERTVGTEIDLRHVAPTPQGEKVTITVRVVHAEDRAVTFQVEAKDQHEIVARGLHKRAIIRVGSFGRRVEGKRSAAPRADGH